jgi:hypothetical protein
MQIAQRKGVKVKRTNVAPLKGTQSLMDYLLTSPKVLSCSVINYAGKDGKVSSTRFEVMMATKNKGKVSPRIIAYPSAKGNYYTMELLCDNLGACQVDQAWLGVACLGRGTAKNGSDLYKMNLENVLKFVRRL